MTQALRARQVTLVQTLSLQAQQGLRDQQGTQEQTLLLPVRLAPLEQQAQQEILAQRALQVQPVQRVRQEQRGTLVPRELLEPLVIQGHKVFRVLEAQALLTVARG